MPIHLYNLLLRSFFAVPGSLGSTWLGLFFPLWGFLLAQVVILLADGWSKMKTHWRQNVVRGFAVAGAAWVSLFLWCIVTTTYEDHMGLAAKGQVLHQALATSDQHEKDAVQVVRTDLDSKLSTLRENCAKTEGANGALSKQTADQQDTINHCQQDALKLLTPEPFKIVPLVLEPANQGVGVQHVKWLVLVNRTVTPVNLHVGCQKRFVSASASILGSGMISGGTAKITDYLYQVNISTPAWSPESPLIFEMSFSGDSNNACSFAQQ
jgi:hypothetical protein